MSTEKKQENSTDNNISLDNIYKALGYLKPEQQGIIISNYKLTELYSICENKETYEKYIRDLFTYANEIINKAGALISLHTEAFKQSMKKSEKVNRVDSMGKAYDQLSEADQKQFCKDMLGKKEFFEESVKMIQGLFENAIEVGEGDSGGDVNEGLSGKVNEKMEK